MNLIISIYNRQFEPKRIQLVFKENWFNVNEIIHIRGTNAAVIVISYKKQKEDWLYTVVPYHIPKIKLMKNDNQDDRTTASWVLILLGVIIGMIIVAITKLKF